MPRLRCLKKNCSRKTLCLIFALTLLLFWFLESLSQPDIQITYSALDESVFIEGSFDHVNVSYLKNSCRKRRTDRSCNTTVGDDPFFLTIVMAWRNDGYGGGDSVGRFQTTLDTLDYFAFQSQIPIELIIVEWNPPKGTKKLAEVVDIPLRINCVRVISVPEILDSVVKGYFGQSNVPIPWSESRNIAIRRARGTYIVPLATNSVLSENFWTFLRSLKVDHSPHDKLIYRIPKAFVDSTPLPNMPPKDVPRFLYSHVEAVCGVGSGIFSRRHGKTLPLTGGLDSQEAQAFLNYTYSISPLDIAYFTEACGDFQMLSRRNFFLLRGYWECSTYAHHDTILQYNAIELGFVGKIPRDMFVFHMHHPESGFANNNFQVPTTDYSYFLPGNGILNPNFCHWGFSSINFDEDVWHYGIKS